MIFLWKVLTEKKPILKSTIKPNPENFELRIYAMNYLQSFETVPLISCYREGGCKWPFVLADPASDPILNSLFQNAFVTAF
jgi:hypothetical protein